MSEGFLDRWSRRKAQARAGLVPDEPLSSVADTPARPEPGAAAGSPDLVEPAAPSPTLEDVQALTPDADFKPFLARGVAPEVRNAAFRKLFADPRFNVMDGLDVYIDDYGQNDPLPPALLRQMASARFLKLVEDGEPAAPATMAEGLRETAADPQPPSVAQSAHGAGQRPDAAIDPREAPPHADPDLQLQPDHAARRPGPGPGAA